MTLTREELVDMVFVLGECNRNPLLASRVYAQRYPARRHPRRERFQDLLQRFVNTGNVQFNKRNRTKPTTTEENEFLVLGNMHPYVSVREITNATGMSSSSVQRIKKKYKYHPFCQWAIQRTNEDRYFFKYVLFSDESTFHKNGYVNRHNCHYYATDNPHIIRATQSQFRWTLNVWAGILGDRIIGPVFFNGHLTGRSYVEFLQTELVNFLDDIPLATVCRMWMQQDGAPPHQVRQARDFLNEHFPNRWIGTGGPIRWTLRSLDLTKCDFFLWDL